MLWLQEVLASVPRQRVLSPALGPCRARPPWQRRLLPELDGQLRHFTQPSKGATRFPKQAAYEGHMADKPVQTCARSRATKKAPRAPDTPHVTAAAVPASANTHAARTGPVICVPCLAESSIFGGAIKREKVEAREKARKLDEPKGTPSRQSARDPPQNVAQCALSTSIRMEGPSHVTWRSLVKSGHPEPKKSKTGTI